MVQQAGDTIQIAYIGDSWAAMHQDDSCKIAKIISDKIHRPAKVYSFGICGLTSKEIYESFYDDSTYKAFLQTREYQYCFISAGINDTYKKMSLQYYKESIDGIIQFLLTNGIRPIILEIPDYDIQKAYRWQKSSRKLLREISIFINNTPVDCKQIFRDALNELISEKGYQDKISVIRYHSWNSHYQKDVMEIYRADGMHLNSKGYTRLDSVIAQEILLHLSKRSFNISH